MIRTAEQWMEIFGSMSPDEAAKNLLGDLTAYPGAGSKSYDAWHEHDEQQLANALEGWAMLFEPH